MIEGQKGMCVIDCCAQFLSLGGRNPPRCSPFLWFCLVLSIFALKYYWNDFLQLHINLYVFGSHVRGKGESVRTRKGCRNNKL